MFEFAKIRVYQKRTIIYSAAIFLLCAFICLYLAGNVIMNKISLFQTESDELFLALQNKIDMHISDVERYIINLYSNPELLKDMTYFLGHSQEEYQSSRLSDSNGSTDIASFVDNVRGFALGKGKDVISEISLHDAERCNIISFKDAGTPILHNVPNDSPAIQNQGNNGFVHSRNLVSVDNISKNIGKINIVFDFSQMVSSATSSYYDGVLLTKGDNVVFTYGSYDNISIGSRFNAAQSLSTEGDLFLFQDAQVVVYNFKNSDLKIALSVNTSTLARQNFRMLLFIMLSGLLMFVILTLIIMINFNQEAKFLNKIVKSIGLVKQGEFSEIEFSKSKSEYGIIAAELNDMSTKLGEYIQTEFVLKIAQKDAEMRALQNQINPHFLYNTLEIIRSMATVHKVDDVADAVSALGRLYREMVKTGDEITMEKEVALLKNYLKIMELRSPDKFYYQINVEESVRQLKTVKFWLQPIAENFFKHGYNYENAFNLLVITGREEEEAYYIEVIDNGARIAEEDLKKIKESFSSDKPPGGIGLSNVYARLQMFYGNAFSMNISNNEKAGISIVVSIKKG